MLVLLILIIVVSLFFLWIMENNYNKKRLKKVIELEGYYERFNSNDIKLRNNQNINDFVNSARILYPWEMLYFLSYTSFLSPKPKIMIFDSKYESGFPHTHGNIILISKIDHLSKTTYKHEQIHIYQRYNPLEVNKVVCETWPIKGIFYKKDNQRANPDTNSIFYETYNAKYVSDPKSLSNIENKNDHPFEEMAYSLQN